MEERAGTVESTRDACDRHYRRAYSREWTRSALAGISEEIAREAVLIKTLPRLTIDLMPFVAWGNTAKRTLPAAEWDLIRGEVYASSYCMCVACGAGPGIVSADEIWELRGSVYTLIGFQSLCVHCHGAKHYGRAQQEGYDDAARSQLRAVNAWTEAEVLAHVTDRLGEFDAFNKSAKSVDLSITAALLARYRSDREAHKATFRMARRGRTPGSVSPDPTTWNVFTAV